MRKFPAATAPKASPRKAAAVKTAQNAVTKHIAALHNTAGAGQKAINAAAKLAQTTAKYEKEQKAGKHAPSVPLVPTKIKGDGRIMLGAPPSVARKLTPKQKAAVQKHTNAIVKHAAIVRQAKAWGPKVKQLGQAAKDWAVKTGKAHSKGTAIHGSPLLGALRTLSDGELINLCQQVGIDVEIGVDANGLSPGDQGYDASTDPDAQGGGGTTGGSGLPAWDQKTGIVTGPDGTVLYDPSQDPGAMGVTPATTADQFIDLNTGIVTAPDGTQLYGGPNNDPDVKQVPAAPGQLSQADAQMVWKNVPPDAIVYDGSSWTRYSKGSWTYFYGPGGGLEHGFIYGWDKMNWPSSTQTRWIARFGKDGLTGNPNWWDSLSTDANVSQASLAGIVARGQPSTGESFGPIIGNPTDPAFAGLQYATSDNKWFWQLAYAPAAATAAIRAANQAAIANNLAKARTLLDDMINAAKKTAQANAAAIYAIALQAANDAAAAAEAQAKQEAADALAQQQQAAAVQAAQSQAEVANITAQQQAQQQQAQIDAQAQQAQLEQVQIWNQFAREHPEQAFAMLQQQGPVDEGEGEAGEEEYYEEEGGGGGGGGEEAAAEGDYGDYVDEEE